MTLRVAATGTRNIPTLNGHSNVVKTIAYTPSGQHLASGSSDSSLRIWDVVSGQCLAVLTRLYEIRQMDWKDSFEGSQLATGSEDGSIRAWHVDWDKTTCAVSLLWSSHHTGLAVSDCNIEGAGGLSRVSIQLLRQRGAVGEPVLPMDLRGASKKVINMLSVVSTASGR